MFFNNSFDESALERIRLEEAQYLALNTKIKEKCNIIIKWCNQKYGVSPASKEGRDYRSRIKSYFPLWIMRDTFMSSSHLYMPIDKLQVIYDKIETEFPEPFVKINRRKKLQRINKL